MPMGRRDPFPNILGHSDVMQPVFALMEEAIDSGCDVLLTGETGTGKELVARAIHDKSSRGNRCLFSIHCGMAPKETLRHELFGHRKDVFNGAIEDQRGLLEAAEESTLLLNEIDAMPLDIQLSLIQVLVERKVQRPGETFPRPVDVRITAIASHDLTQLVETGHFRQDLYIRLKAFEIRLSPLRERSEDILLLAEHFCEEVCRQLSRRLMGFTPAIQEALSHYHWPGNVGQLRSVIRRACTLAEEGEHIQIRHLPPEIIHHVSTQ